MRFQHWREREPIVTAEIDVEHHNVESARRNCSAGFGDGRRGCGDNAADAVEKILGKHGDNGFILDQ